MRSDLEPRLRGLYPRAVDGQAEHERAHEGELVAAVSRRQGEAAGAAGQGRGRLGGSGSGGRGRGRGWLGRLRMPRLALAGVLGVAVAVGACVMPAEYPVSLGYGFEIVLPVERWAELDPEAIAMHVQEQTGVERIEVRVHRMQHEHVGERAAADGGMRMQLFVFGDGVEPDALLDELQASFPVLADAELHDVPLSGTVHGTFGGQLSHRFLDLTIDQHGVEEAERQVLAVLVAEGIAAEDVTVDITEELGEGGQRRIEVRIEAEHVEHAPLEPER
jgi:hypothetical protein